MFIKSFIRKCVKYIYRNFLLSLAYFFKGASFISVFQKSSLSLASFFSKKANNISLLLKVSKRALGVNQSLIAIKNYYYIIKKTNYHFSTALKLLNAEKNYGSRIFYDHYLFNYDDLPQPLRSIAECNFYERGFLPDYSLLDALQQFQINRSNVLLDCILRLSLVYKKEEALISLVDFLKKESRNDDYSRCLQRIYNIFLELGMFDKASSLAAEYNHIKTSNPLSSKSSVKAISQDKISNEKKKEKSYSSRHNKSIDASSLRKRLAKGTGYSLYCKIMLYILYYRFIKDVDSLIIINNFIENKEGYSNLHSLLSFWIFRLSENQPINLPLKIIALEEEKNKISYKKKLIAACKNEKYALIIESRYALFDKSSNSLLSRVKNYLSSDFDFLLANFSVQVATLEVNREFIFFSFERLKQCCDLSVSTNDTSLNRLIVLILAGMYKLGDRESLRLAASSIDLENDDFNLYVGFSESNIFKALEYRAKGLRKAFLRLSKKQIIENNNIDLLTLSPEKDLCGEVFNAAFYKDLIKNFNAKISVICDSRMQSILERTFPGITFVPKICRDLKSGDYFESLSLQRNLNSFIDKSSYLKTEHNQFISLPYAQYESSENFLSSRRQGWLKPDTRKVEYWKNFFSVNKNKKIIGISSNSTLRSKIRDFHMVGIEHWEKIFKLDDVCFVNLNARFQDFDLPKNFGVDVIDPKFDLYNDFESLLALMSILDYAIVPANNLMDFAASVGIKTVVFSPSCIMKFWVFEEDNSYFFSEHVKFIFPEGGVDHKEMVASAALYIQNDINRSKS